MHYSMLIKGPDMIWDALYTKNRIQTLSIFCKQKYIKIPTMS